MTCYIKSIVRPNNTLLVWYEHHLGISSCLFKSSGFGMLSNCYPLENQMQVRPNLGPFCCNKSNITKYLEREPLSTRFN